MTDWQYKIGALGSVVTGIEEIAQSILLILHTPKGTVPYLPEFGCDLLSYMGQPLAEGRIVESIILALERWEPRIAVESIRVTLSEGQAAIAGTYIVRATGEVQEFPAILTPEYWSIKLAETDPIGVES